MRAIRTAAWNAGQLLLIAFTLGPIVWVFMMSLKGYRDVVAYPPKFTFSVTFENYQSVLFGDDNAIGGGAGEFTRYLLNSVVISSLAVMLSLLIGVPAAYALSRNRIKNADSLAFTFLSLRFAPELAVIIPLYAMFQRLKLYDTYLGLVLAHQLITIPLVIWITRTFLNDVPVEIEEAAEIDGCSPMRALIKVVLPIIRPGLASAAILGFVFSWNNLLMGLVLAGSNTQPVTVGILQAIGFDQVRWGWMAAASMIAAIPGMIFAVYLQRHLIRGLTMGVGK